MEYELDIVFSLHGGSYEVTEETDYIYRQHIGHALGIAAETNKYNLIDRLVNEEPEDVDVFRIAAIEY